MWDKLHSHILGIFARDNTKSLCLSLCTLKQIGRKNIITLDARVTYFGLYVGKCQQSDWFIVYRNKLLKDINPSTISLNFRAMLD